MDEILWYRISSISSSSSGSHELGSEYPAGPRASKKLCQPDNVTATKIRCCMTVPMRSTYLSAYKSSSSKLTMYWPLANKTVALRLAPTVRSSPTGHLIAIYFNRQFSSAMRRKMDKAGFHHHHHHQQLLLFPRLVNSCGKKALPQLRMKTCSRCGGWILQLQRSSLTALQQDHQGCTPTLPQSRTSQVPEFWKSKSWRSWIV